MQRFAVFILVAITLATTGCVSMPMPTETAMRCSGVIKKDNGHTTENKETCVWGNPYSYTQPQPVYAVPPPVYMPQYMVAPAPVMVPPPVYMQSAPMFRAPGMMYRGGMMPGYGGQRRRR